MPDNMDAAGICGLFCESCTLFIATKENTGLELLAKKYDRNIEEMRCKGCRSDTVSFYCRTCAMKRCAAEKGYVFCSECEEYPCDTLKEFQVKMPHRLELFDSLDYIRDNGFKAWKEKMKKDYSCESCGAINSIYVFECRKCNHHPSNPYVGRNIEKIINAIKK